MPYPRSQFSIAQPVSVRGFGYWTGLDVTVEFRPAPLNAGITFVRRDLGVDARIPARVEHRIDVPRRTNLRLGRVQVDMVEHVLAALAGMQIDNCEVWVDQAEMPGCDGSALPFVDALLTAGVVAQPGPAPRLEITSPVRVADGEAWIAAHPSSEGVLSIEFELHYPHNRRIGRQSTQSVITPESFRSELAPCRTFVLQAEANQMVQQGLGTRVTTSDLLVFDEQGPIENQLRFANECARHKALDVLGDLALTGCDVIGRFVAHRSSHRLNAALAREIIAQRTESDTPLRATA